MLLPCADKEITVNQMIQCGQGIHVILDRCDVMQPEYFYFATCAGKCFQYAAENANVLWLCVAKCGKVFCVMIVDTVIRTRLVAAAKYIDLMSTLA